MVISPYKGVVDTAIQNGQLSWCNMHIVVIGLSTLQIYCAPYDTLT